MDFVTLKEERLCEFPRIRHSEGLGKILQYANTTVREIHLPIGYNDQLISAAEPGEVALLIDAGSACFAISDVQQNGLALDIHDVSPDTPAALEGWRIVLPHPVANLNNQSDHCLRYLVTDHAILVYILLSSGVVHKLCITRGTRGHLQRTRDEGKNDSSEAAGARRTVDEVDQQAVAGAGGAGTTTGLCVQWVQAMELPAEGCGFSSFAVASEDTVVFGTEAGLRVCRFSRQQYQASVLDGPYVVVPHQNQGEQQLVKNPGDDDSMMMFHPTNGTARGGPPPTGSAGHVEQHFAQLNGGVGGRGAFAPQPQPPREDTFINDAGRFSFFSKPVQNILVVASFGGAGDVLTYASDGKLRLTRAAAVVSSDYSRQTRQGQHHGTSNYKTAKTSTNFTYASSAASGTTLTRCDVQELIEEDQFSLRIAVQKEKIVIGAKRLFLVAMDREKGLQPVQEIITTHPTMCPSFFELTPTSLFLLYRRGGVAMDEILHIDLASGLDSWEASRKIQMETRRKQAVASGAKVDTIHPVHTWHHEEQVWHAQERALGEFGDSSAFEEEYERHVSCNRRETRKLALLARKGGAAEFLRQFWLSRIFQRNRFSEATLSEVISDLVAMEERVSAAKRQRTSANLASQDSFIYSSNVAGGPAPSVTTSPHAAATRHSAGGGVQQLGGGAPSGAAFYASSGLLNATEGHDFESRPSTTPAPSAVSVATVRALLERRAGGNAGHQSDARASGTTTTSRTTGGCGFSAAALEFIDYCRDRERRRKTLFLGKVRCYAPHCVRRTSNTGQGIVPVARLTSTGLSVLRPIVDPTEQLWDTFVTFRAMMQSNFIHKEALLSLSTDDDFLLAAAAQQLPSLVGESRMSVAFASLAENPHALPEVRQTLRDIELGEPAKSEAAEAFQKIGDLQGAGQQVLHALQGLHLTHGPPAGLLSLQPESRVRDTWNLGDLLLGSVARSELATAALAMRDIWAWLDYHRLPAPSGTLFVEEQAEHLESLADFLALQVPFMHTVLHTLSLPAQASGSSLLGAPPAPSAVDEWMRLRAVTSGGTDDGSRGGENRHRAAPESRAVMTSSIMINQRRSSCLPHLQNLNIPLLLLRLSSSGAVTNPWPLILNFTEALPVERPVSPMYFRARWHLMSQDLDDACALFRKLLEDFSAGEMSELWLQLVPEVPRWAELLADATAQLRPQLGYCFHVANVLLQQQGSTVATHAIEFLERACKIIEEDVTTSLIANHGRGGTTSRTKQGSSAAGGNLAQVIEDEPMLVDDVNEQVDVILEDHHGYPTTGGAGVALDTPTTASSTVVLAWWGMALEFALEHKLWGHALRLVDEKMAPHSLSGAKRALLKLSFLLRKSGALTVLVPHFTALRREMQEALLQDLIAHRCEKTLYSLALAEAQDVRAAYIALRMYEQLREESERILADNLGTGYQRQSGSEGHFTWTLAKEPLLYGEFLSSSSSISASSGTATSSSDHGGLLPSHDKTEDYQRSAPEAVEASSHDYHDEGENNMAAATSSPSKRVDANHEDAEVRASALHLASTLLHAVPAALLKRQRDCLLLCLAAKPEPEFLYLPEEPQSDPNESESAVGVHIRSRPTPTRARPIGATIGLAGAATEAERLQRARVRGIFRSARRQAAEAVLTSRDLRRKVAILEARIFLAESPLRPLGMEISGDCTTLSEIFAGSWKPRVFTTALLHDPRYLASKLAQQGLAISAVHLCQYFEGIDVFQFALRPFTALLLHAEKTAGGAAAASEPAHALSVLVEVAAQAGLLRGMFLRQDGTDSLLFPPRGGTASSSSSSSKAGLAEEAARRSLWLTLESLTLRLGFECELCELLLSQSSERLPVSLVQAFFFCDTPETSTTNFVPTALSTTTARHFLTTTSTENQPSRVRSTATTSQYCTEASSTSTKWTQLLRMLMQYGRLEEIMALLEKKVERRGFTTLDDHQRENHLSSAIRGGATASANVVVPGVGDVAGGGVESSRPLLLQLRNALRQQVGRTSVPSTPPAAMQQLEVLAQCVRRIDRMLEGLPEV
ncbi:unnamed protein product [Amoebophrya sp. A25]|nr:unnamed protein product [Amoebophrya sp. A25]|eukprot:GSA25T00014162001.1